MSLVARYDHRKIANIIDDYRCNLTEDRDEGITNYINLLFCCSDRSVSISNCSEAFWKRRECWWHPFVEQKYHHLGRHVFDKGLHGGPVEPGYYESLLNAACYGLKYIGNKGKITVAFYKMLHRLAIAHFRGDEKSDTLIPSWKGGVFLGAKSARLFHLSQAKHYLPSSLNQLLICVASKKDKIKLITKYLNDVEKSANSMFKYYFKWEGSIDFGLDENDTILIGYNFPPEKLESAVNEVFERFNRAMEALDLAKNKAQAKLQKALQIARLFQVLEWLHPFPDGQGRTDLLLLNLLSSLHLGQQLPLDCIFYSSQNTPKNWYEYLKKAMVREDESLFESDYRLMKEQISVVPNQFNL